jgi:hypothetical protein
MINLIARAILFVAAAITSWFVAEDAANFSSYQMTVGLILVAALVAVGAFWETLADLFRSKKDSC